MEGTHSYGFGRSEAIIVRLDFLVKISQGWTKALAGFVPFWKLCGKHISRCLQGIGRIHFLSMLSTWHLHLQVSNSWWSPAHLPSATFLFLKIFFFFWCGLFLKSLLNLPQYCFCFLLGFFRPWGIWNLSSLTRDQTHTPWSGKGSLNQWSIREVPWHTSWVLRTHVITLGPTGESRINSLF